MKNIFIWSVAIVFLSISSVHARQHQKVGRCDYDAQTYVETCYDEDNNLLNGWAVEGNEPDNAVRNRRKIRKLKRAQKRDDGKTEEYVAELKEILQPYTLSKFRDGKREGLSREIDPYNFDLKRINYKKGRKDGPYELYYLNHTMKVSATYKDGVPNGKAIFYSSRGRKIGVARYRRGVLLKGYCKDQNGDKVAMQTDGKNIVTEVTPCPDVSNKD